VGTVESRRLFIVASGVGAANLLLGCKGGVTVAMSAKQLDEIGDLFEDIEHKTFGKDGFDDAVDQVAAIERAFGLDLAQFTAPPPRL
jgi:hypothetical protein